MRKLVLVLLITGFAVSCAVGQASDSIKKAVVKPAQLRMLNGVQLSSADDLFTNLSKSKIHTTFISLITAAGLGDVIKSKGNLTVFAPTDDAFNKLQPGIIDTLMKPTHLADLTKLINYYIVQGKLTSADIAKQIKANHGEATIQTLSGVLKAKINSDRNIFLTDEIGEQAIVSQLDIAQSNGLLFVIKSVISPKPN